MNATWEAQFVDTQVDRAWMDLRLRVADRLAAALTGEVTEPLDITTATGKTLTASVADGHVVVAAGDTIHTSANVDEAAFIVFQVLHDQWQVVHPTFLDTELVEVAVHPDRAVSGTASAEVVVPHLGRPESAEQLRAWVRATFQEGRTDELKSPPNGDIRWATKRGEVLVVSVRNESRIELWTVLGRQVGRKKAAKVIARLSKEYFGLKFYVRQDELIMSRTVIAKPFVPEHLTSAFYAFLRVSDSLGDIAEEVLRNWVKVERRSLADAEAATAAAEQAQAEAEAARAEAEERARQAEQMAASRLEQRNRIFTNFKAMRAQWETVCDGEAAAVAELAALKNILEKALGHQQFQSLTDRGDLA